MGQAKLRGSFEARQVVAIARNREIAENKERERLAKKALRDEEIRLEKASIPAKLQELKENRSSVRHDAFDSHSAHRKLSLVAAMAIMAGLQNDRT